ncbi:MAG: YjbQ family protein [Candidatus Bathyarchaeia archaeon]
MDMVKNIADDYPKGAGWSHDKIDDNADAHLASAFIGSSRIFPVKDGRLARGIWQNPFDGGLAAILRFDACWSANSHRYPLMAPIHDSHSENRLFQN